MSFMSRKYQIISHSPDNKSLTDKNSNLMAIIGNEISKVLTIAIKGNKF